MGKSIRAKSERRKRRAKREIIEEQINKKRNERLYELSKLAQQGLETMRKMPKNGFLHPEAPDARIPQREQLKEVLDLRAVLF